MLAEISSEKLDTVLANLEAEKSRRVSENKLQHFKPYAKQLEFFAAGATHRERLFAAANQVGKTTAGGFEAAILASGRYPAWWNGRRIDGANIGWVCGVTTEGVCDTGQRLLLGRSGEYGTGTLPKETIAEVVAGPRCS